MSFSDEFKELIILNRYDKRTVFSNYKPLSILTRKNGVVFAGFLFFLVK